MDRKREVITTFQQLNHLRSVIWHFFSWLIQLFGSPSRNVLRSIDIILWITRNLYWLDRRRWVGQFRIKLSCLASNLSKTEHNKVFLHVFSISPIGFLVVVGGIRPSTLGSRSLIYWENVTGQGFFLNPLHFEQPHTIGVL